MSLARQRDYLALAQVALAAIGVVWAQGTSVWVALIAAAFATHAFVRPLPAETSPVAQRRWTLGVMLAVAASAYRALMWSQVLDAGVDLLLFLAVQRLYCRQRTREHLQLMLIGGLLMTIGAVINVDLNYPVLLVPYFVVTAMGLLLNQLTAAGERLGPAVTWAIDRHTRKSQRVLWRSAIQIAGLVALGGLAVFFVFPRFGVGTFVRGATPTRMASGFSPEVELGHFGTIRGDASVVMRVRADAFADEPVPHLPLYFRGSSFDAYHDGRWRHTQGSFTAGIKRFMSMWATTDAHGRLLVEVDRSQGALGRVVARPIDGWSSSTQIHTFDMTLEDIGTELVIAPDQVLTVDTFGDPRLQRLRPGNDGQVLTPNRHSGAVRYTTRSRITLPTAFELDEIGNPSVDNLDRYLATPRVLTPRFRQLATGLVADATTRSQRVDAVLAYLGTLTYTTDLAPFVSDPVDPIEGFLFETRAGHCEYFATAAALLLREAGVPTRLVNGYLGADWNAIGNYYAVRQAHAHSWIEVHFGPLGWLRVDPTPPNGRPGPALATHEGRWSQWMDALRNAYLQYVIDYGYDDQRELLRGLFSSRRESARRDPRALLPGVAAVAAVFGVVWGWRWWRRRRLVPVEVLTARRVLRALARIGFERRLDESLPALARRLEHRHLPFAAELSAFARRYDAARFGPKASPAARRELVQAARRLIKAIRRGSHHETA